MNTYSLVRIAENTGHFAIAALLLILAIALVS